jgi:hypothetical protein
MLILPLDHPSAFAATAGVMLYPGEDGEEQEKAAEFAARYVNAAIQQHLDKGGELVPELQLRMEVDPNVRLDDFETRLWDGSVTGVLLQTLFELYQTDPDLASWENAIRLTERTAAKFKVSGSRTSLWSARSRFHTVAHLWAAWTIRDRQFQTQLEAGYDGVDDFQSFLTESEIIRHWGQTWRPRRANAKPLLPKEVWRVPEDWAPPDRQPGWPRTGGIPGRTVPPELLAGLRKAGRPRKNS